MEMTVALDPKVAQFIGDCPQGVLTTYRNNGTAQMSIVTVRVHRDAIGVSITEDRSKFKKPVAQSAMFVAHFIGRLGDADKRVALILRPEHMYGTVFDK